jgi:hypothetical protein
MTNSSNYIYIIKKLLLVHLLHKSWLIFLLLYFLILFLIYLPTFLHPYLLTDETWLIAIPGSHVGLGDGFGRYLFAFISWGMNELFQKIGFYSIYFIRGFAVFWLALSGFFLMRWFEYWGHEKFLSFLLSILILTLPAYQIVVADGAPLAFAIFTAIVSTYYFFTSADNLNWKKYILLSVLLIFSLTTYQQQVLVALAMLIVPLLQKKDWLTYKSVVIYGCFVTLVTFVYFVVWKFILYPRAFPGRIDERYGPHAISIPSIDQFFDFFSNRLLQISNLWNVQQPHINIVVCIILSLILIKIFFGTSKLFIFKFPVLVGLVFGADFFRFITGAYHSYVTAPAISLVILYMAFSGLYFLFRKKTIFIIFLLTIYGSFMAFNTVKNEIAIPVSHHFNQIKESVLKNPSSTRFHLDFSYKNDSVATQEFQWRNGGVYLFHMATSVFEDLAINGEISKDRLLLLKEGLSLGGVHSEGLPNWMQRESHIDSVLVRLDKP